MKAFLVISFLSFGSLAMACPDLSGAYYCPDERESQSNLAITQVERDGVTTYTMNDFETTVLIADGVKRRSEEIGGGFKKISEQVIACEGDVLNWSETYVVSKTKTGDLIASGDKSVSIKRGEDGDLLSVGREILDFQGQKKTNVINDTCIRQRL